MYKSVRDMIREARIAKGLKQWEVCNGLCWPFEYEWFEAGKFRMNHKQLKVLCERLGVDVTACLLESAYESTLYRLQTVSGGDLQRYAEILDREIGRETDPYRRERLLTTKLELGL